MSFFTNLAVLLKVTIYNFGFKKNLGYNYRPGVYLLQNVTDYFVCRSSPVAYLYGSTGCKQRHSTIINHAQLFVKLSERGVPQCFINVLQNWYIKLTSCVRWNGILSAVFRVTCGVRQGRILSPFLFNIYVDELLYLLSNSGHRHHVGTVLYGCIG